MILCVTTAVNEDDVFTKHFHKRIDEAGRIQNFSGVIPRQGLKFENIWDRRAIPLSQTSGLAATQDFLKLIAQTALVF